MNLKVLRPADGVMMKLVKYELTDGTDVSGSSTSVLIHNHNLSETDQDSETSVTTVDKSGTAGGSTVTVSDITGAAQVISSDTAVATAAVGTNSITITPVAAGTATITVLDSNGTPITIVNMTVAAG